MSLPEIPKAEQLSPAERLARLSMATVEAMGRATMRLYGLNPPDKTYREQLGLAILQLESYANDPLQH